MPLVVISSYIPGLPRSSSDLALDSRDVRAHEELREADGQGLRMAQRFRQTLHPHLLPQELRLPLPERFAQCLSFTSNSQDSWTTQTFTTTLSNAFKLHRLNLCPLFYIIRTSSREIETAI